MAQAWKAFAVGVLDIVSQILELCVYRLGIYEHGRHSEGLGRDAYAPHEHSQ